MKLHRLLIALSIAGFVAVGLNSPRLHATPGVSSQKSSKATSKSKAKTEKTEKADKADKKESKGKTYTNKNGQKVKSPTRSTTPPKNASAKCKDGTYSFSKHSRGTCSGHGGVDSWVKKPTS
jgi:hypothetical protein